MIEMKYDVYFDEEVVAKDMELDDALILVKGLTQAYTRQMSLAGSRISVVLSEKSKDTMSTEEG